MRRRELLSRGAAGALALAVAPLAARAQEPRVAKVALVATGIPVERVGDVPGSRFALLHAEFSRLGYVEGRSFMLTAWSTAGLPETQFDELARRVVASGPDIIVANGSRLVLALKAATRTIPVVFSGSDPVGNGLVDSLNRPGGNLTGFASDAGPDMEGKRLQFLREVAPDRDIFVHLATPQLSTTGTSAVELRAVAARAQVRLVPVLLEGTIGPGVIRRALSELANPERTAIIISPGPDISAHADELAQTALAMRLPTIGQISIWPRAGCLMSYGIDIEANWALMATYADRILRGARPAELPVQQPTRFEFVINLKTAKALGLTIPERLLVFATEVIE
jgi:putative tryptophan/tyrosine transport system substrate-binding protein